MRNPWTVLVLAVLILVLRILVGSWRQQDWLFLALMVLLGMIPPLTPIMAGIGLAGLLIIVLRHYPQVAGAQRGSFFSNVKTLFPTK